MREWRTVCVCRPLRRGQPKPTPVFSVKAIVSTRASQITQRSSTEEGSKSWRTIYLNFLHPATPRGRRHTQQLLLQLFSGDPPSAPGLIWSVVICSLLAPRFLAPCGQRNFWFPRGTCDYNVQMYSTRSQLQTFLYSCFEFNTSNISGCCWALKPWPSVPAVSAEASKKKKRCYWSLILNFQIVLNMLFPARFNTAECIRAKRTHSLIHPT